MYEAIYFFKNEIRAHITVRSRGRLYSVEYLTVQWTVQPVYTVTTTTTTTTTSKVSGLGWWSREQQSSQISTVSSSAINHQYSSIAAKRISSQGSEEGYCEEQKYVWRFAERKEKQLESWEWSRLEKLREQRTFFVRNKMIVSTDQQAYSVTIMVKVRLDSVLLVVSSVIVSRRGELSWAIYHHLVY